MYCIAIRVCAHLLQTMVLQQGIGVFHFKADSVPALFVFFFFLYHYKFFKKYI